MSVLCRKPLLRSNRRVVRSVRVYTPHARRDMSVRFRTHPDPRNSMTRRPIRMRRHDRFVRAEPDDIDSPHSVDVLHNPKVWHKHYPHHERWRIFRDQTWTRRHCCDTAVRYRNRNPRYTAWNLQLKSTVLQDTDVRFRTAPQFRKEPNHLQK